MNREIKFRAWHTTANKMFSAEEMAEDQLTLLTTGQFINVHGGSTELSTIYPVDKIIPMQFAGLKDKNGKEIYEGDILGDYAREHDMIEGTVIFDNASFGIKTEMFENILTLATYVDIGDFDELEIIGNIYENPELLNN